MQINICNSETCLETVPQGGPSREVATVHKQINTIWKGLANEIIEVMHIFVKQPLPLPDDVVQSTTDITRLITSIY